uniref:Uncharacterized protein n=1 Tax=viral metagenome TaxID=1070528 RepID=A0A6C0AH81_9ZZZZ
MRVTERQVESRFRRQKSRHLQCVPRAPCLGIRRLWDATCGIENTTIPPSMAMDCIQKHLPMMDCSEEEIVRALALCAPVLEREVINPYSRALPAGWGL